MRRYFILAASLLLATSGFAQSADEALRYSQLRFGGSARGMATAGAFGAVGADFSSIINNPAGLALYQKHEVMFSFRFEGTRNEGLYDGTSASDSRFNFNVGNIGAAFAGKKDRGGWKNINFGIGYNRLANFSGERLYVGRNTSNSILETYKNELTGIPVNQIGNTSLSFETDLAWQGYLLNPIDSTNYSAVTDNTTVDQQINIETRGAIDELSFSVAGNYKHKLYIGGYLGIPFLFYKERGYHREINTNAGSQWFNSFDMNDHLNTFGVGVNFKMGLIYRPSDWVRLGAAFHTPTYYGMHDDFSTTLIASFDTTPDPDLYFPLTNVGEFDYGLTTPMRFIGSAAVIIKKYGFISFDYELVDHSRANYHTDDIYSSFENEVNQDIELLYGKAHVFRVGAEGVLDNFRLRAGYAYYTSPYENAEVLGDYDGSAMYFTGGLGIRLKKVYFDLAYVRGVSKSIGLVVNDELALDETIRNSVVITTGFRF